MVRARKKEKKAACIFIVGNSVFSKKFAEKESLK